LSGPGPYWGFQFPLDRLVCIVTSDGPGVTTGNRFTPSENEKDLACANDGGVKGVQIRAYLSVEFSRANSKANDLFPAVAFTSVKPILFYRVPRLHETLDIGTGLGGNRFSGKDFAFWRWSVPLRGRIFCPGLESGSQCRAVHLALQADYLPMSFTSVDF